MSPCRFVSMQQDCRKNQYDLSVAPSFEQLHTPLNQIIKRFMKLLTRCHRWVTSLSHKINKNTVTLNNHC
jgi:hypothetical protein